MIIRENNIVLQSLHKRPFLMDVIYENDAVNKPLIVFSHGFSGFKDWGPFALVAEQFAASGFVFVKFNFSHNGTTVEQPVDFVDLEAFGNDNISIELDDLGVVIDWLFSADCTIAKADWQREKVFLLGHSRGGGISILKAREDKRVNKLCTWAGLNEVGKYWSAAELEQIKRDGVVFKRNSRTGQMMPIRWQMYEDYNANLKRLFIPDAVRQLQIPFLVVHGSKDETVPVECAYEMKAWNENARLYVVEGGNHTFGGKHPWNNSSLPDDLSKVVDETMRFFGEK